jgi:prepilin-type N-terminal cleavage/methylation domain-containing protein
MVPRCRTNRSSARSWHQGFTLIELLIVVVVIGILAAIAIPKFANTKEKALVAAMKSDLRNVAGTQEGYWNANQTYYAGVVPDPALAFNFIPSQGVTITIINSTAAGWSAKATGLPVTNTQCFIFYGTTPPVPPASADAAVACN